MSDEEQKIISCLTAKQIKAIAKPEFAKSPEKFYPTKTLSNLGYHRSTCKCGNNYWRKTEERKTCGDSNCEKCYNFIGVGTGIGRGASGKKITYAGAWETFRKSLCSADVPCTAIPRYPVVARWRADVDYVAAGIYCFQPYCVTGELEPPANPLICPQFCLRFNDLDNVGLTGRHYSGFVMLGIQVFNTPRNYKFWIDECIQFNYNWLTVELGINPDEITFVEDVWAGGGNLGPSIEYFVGGLEVGNMVFMQFKTFPDGSREPLQVQIIDVGIGLERIPWLINGSATSYEDIFPRALEFLLSKIDLESAKNSLESKDNVTAEIWKKYGPYSCLLNIDEVEDIDKTWAWIAEKIGETPKRVKQAIEPIKDAYVVCDHTRTILMAIEDGSLPSNVGGASNVRNILRRVFSILAKRGWWDNLKMEGFLELFNKHKEDLATLYGPFKEYKSFANIIRLEYNRWKNTDTEQQKKLVRLLKKRKNVLTIDDWILSVTSWGLPADTISNVSGLEIPGNLYDEIARRQESQMIAQAPVLYDTAHLEETQSLYYEDHDQYEFTAQILEVLPNVTQEHVPSIVILDRSHFYPTSGGQDHDSGKLWIDDKEYQVVDVFKVGPCVLHILEPPLSINSTLSIEEALNIYKGKDVRGQVNSNRREQLRNNHSATHVVYAACRQVLGPHVWQNGAKKSIEQAHLDITHYQSLTHEEVLNIQTNANRIVHKCKQITKGFMPKDEAEKKYGFHLYQGGVVPGNTLRVVNIAGTDTEACCGTHCDNTAEIGTIKILKTGRISDGIVRLYYVAGEKALTKINEETKILNSLVDSWGVGSLSDIPKTASRFFNGYKKLSIKTSKQDLKILELQMRCHILEEDSKLVVFKSDQSNIGMFLSNMPMYAERLKENNKGVVYVGNNFVYGLLGSKDLFDAELFKTFFDLLDSAEEKGNKKKKKIDISEHVKFRSKNKKKKVTKINDVIQFSCKSIPNPKGQSDFNPNFDRIIQFFISHGFQCVE